MARAPISQTLRSALSADLSTPGYKSSETSAASVKAGVRKAMASAKATANEIYGGDEEDTPLSTGNRAGWLATIGEAFSGAIFGRDEEDTTTPASTYDEEPILSPTLRETSEGIIEPSRRDDVALTGNFDYNAVRDQIPAMNDDVFTESAEQVAANLSVPVNWLYAVIDTESGFSPTIRNQMYVEQGREEDAAIGLIQFMPRTARDLGTTVDNLKNMSITEQLTYVERFYEQNADKINSPEDMYVATFYPRALGESDDFVLGSERRNSSEAIADIVSGNAPLDRNNDGRITLGEVKEFYRNSRGYSRFIEPFQMASN